MNDNDLPEIKDISDIHKEPSIKPLSQEEKDKVIAAVDRTVLEYGEVLRRLSRT